MHEQGGSPRTTKGLITMSWEIAKTLAPGITIQYTTGICNGPNANCKRHTRNGKTVHAILAKFGNANHASLVLPEYHFETLEIAIARIEHAYHNAITIENDAMLYDARERKIPHFIPRGFIDPTRR